MTRPRLLDLFCGAGGAAMGYHRAGFDVMGVDIAPQPHYPFEFHQLDAMAMCQDRLIRCWHEGGGSTLPGRSTVCLGHFDAIHASPPCPAYSVVTPDRSKHPDLYGPTRDRLAASGLPWVIENVIGAPYRSGIVLCGSMFGLRVRRHRNFEMSHAMFCPPCRHREQGTVLGVYGDGGPGKSTRPSGGGGTKAPRAQWAELMGMPWATWREAAQAIPPAYTEFIGAHLMAVVTDAARLP